MSGWVGIKLRYVLIVTEIIRLDLAVFWVHVRSALTNAFAVSMSLHMTAKMVTLAGFPQSAGLHISP